MSNRAHWFISLALITGLCLASRHFLLHASQDKKPASDKERIVGTWRFTKVRMAVDVPVEGLGFVPLLTLTKEGTGTDDFASPVDRAGNAMGFKYKLAGPDKIDVTFGSEQRTGIYKFDGANGLTMCFSLETGSKRPTEFKAEKGHVLYVLARTEPLSPAQLAKRKAAFAKLQMDAARGQSANNLKQIGLAMQSYHDVYKALPLQAIYSKDGKTPLLSWRVAILPYLEEDALYKEFKLDEPWDSAHNKKLIPKMPQVYDCPTAPEKISKEGKTFYQVFTGAGTLFAGNKKMTFQAITDGTSNTILAIEASDPVIWTRPQDLTLPKEKDKMPAVGGLFKNGVHVLFVDSSVRFFRPDPPAALLRALVSPNGGEVVDFKKLEQKEK